MSSGCERGRVELRSAGPITFGPAGILFLADNAAATVFAVDVADPGPAGGSEPFDLADVDARVGSFLGCEPGDVVIKDMAVHPLSHNVYLSVQRGHGEAAQAVLVRISRLDGSITDVPLEDVPVAAAAIGDAPAEDDERLDITLPLGDEGEELQVGERKIRILRQPIRTSTVTDMAYVDGTLLIAGLSNEEFSSRLRRIPFPFRDGVTGSSLEIFHVSHGKWETAAPIRAFVPYDGGASILASYTCTPVVHFPLADLTDGAKAVGRTVAELGAVNQPLDMVSFVQDGEEYLLVANSAHGLVKIACRDIDSQPPLTEPKQPVGVPRETKDLQGIRRLANLGGSYVLALQSDDAAPAPAFPEDRVLVAVAVTEASWSRSGAADCIRLTGVPAGAEVRVFPGTAAARGGLPPMAGRLVRDGDGLCFVPRFAFLDGTAYTVTVEGTSAAVLVRARSGRPAVTEVTGISPTAAEVPVNLLRLYVWFSAPMSEGYAAGQVRLARDDGSIIAGALLPAEHELWDASRAAHRPAGPCPHQARPGRPPGCRVPAAIRRAVPAGRRQRIS